MVIKPNLAATIKGEEDIKSWPVYVSPKLDGVRALIVNGVAQSRSGKPIPNSDVQQLFAGGKLDGLDGELVCGPPYEEGCYNRTTSQVMSVQGGSVGLVYYVFDCWDDQHMTWDERLSGLEAEQQDFPPFVKLLPQKLAHSWEEVLQWEEHWLAQGYEGLMLRGLNCMYKHGRSTIKEGGLLKLKRFEDAEATVIEVLPLMENHNAAEVGELGQTKRSKKKAGLRAAKQLGSLVVQDKEGRQFNIGSGFTQQARITYWKNRRSLVGEVVKYKFQPTGTKDLPRFPVFLGFRSKIDL